MLREVDPVELETPRLVLRPYRDDHAKELYAAARESVGTVGEWMPWCHAGYRVEDSTSWVTKIQLAWRNGEEFAFAIFDREDRYVGGAGLNHFNALHDLANLGYWVRESRQREGLAVESTVAVATVRLRDAAAHAHRDRHRRRQPDQPAGGRVGRREPGVRGAKPPRDPRRAGAGRRLLAGPR